MNKHHERAFAQMAKLRIPTMRRPPRVAALTREQLETRIAKLPGAHALQLYYVANDDGEPEPDHDFCRRHALKKAEALQANTGTEHWIAQGWAESDSIRLCETCDRPLSAGGFSDYGVDSALGLTESNPLRVHVYPAELALASSAMMKDDPRWPLWDHHARQRLAAIAKRRKMQRAKRSRR